MSPPRGQTNIVEFYKQHDPKPDARGRMLEDILKWSDHKLEEVHDYIQVIFPLPEPSSVGWNAPIIDEAVYDAFNKNGGQFALHKNLQRSFIRILAFYGFDIPESEKIVPRAGQQHAGVNAEWADNHQTCFANWIRGGHNNLRISRIIRCTRVLGRQDLAEVFMEALESVWRSHQYKKICDQGSMEWWIKSYTWPLYSRPNGEKGVVSPGLQWLKNKIEAQNTAGSSTL